MGFGIAFLGYCFLLLHSAGLGVIGAPLLAYGFFLAARLDSHFYAASVSSMFLLPRSVFVLFSVFLPATGSELDLSSRFPWLDLGTYLLFFVAWFFLIFWHCLAVRRIAADCGHVKLQRTASRQFYLSSVFILFAISMVVCQHLIDDARILLVAYIFYYVILILNLFFTHTCLVLITSEKQYEKDKQAVAEQDRQAAERRARDLERERYGRTRKNKK